MVNGLAKIGAACAAFAAIVAAGAAQRAGRLSEQGGAGSSSTPRPAAPPTSTVRIVAERLSRIWNQQVLALNHPGAGGSIAARTAAQSPNDGYTLSFAAASTFTALAGAPGVPANLPIQVPRDFLPIGFVSQQPMFLAASPKSGINSIADLIARAKKSPGEISYATTGVGRITHLTMELLQMRAGIKLQMIPYAGGPSQALARSDRRPRAHRARRLWRRRPRHRGRLDQGHRGRDHQAPAGIPEPADGGGNAAGLLRRRLERSGCPAGYADAIIRKVSADLRAALEDKGVQAKLAAIGTYVQPMTPEELTTFINEQQKIWKPVAEAVASRAEEIKVGAWSGFVFASSAPSH